MNEELSHKASCPYCGETIELLIDCSAGSQQYIEDCFVCCRPIEVFVSESDSDDPVVELRAEYE